MINIFNNNLIKGFAMKEHAGRRLQEFIDYLKKTGQISSANDFSIKIGSNKSYVSVMCSNGRSVTNKTASKIHEVFPSLNINWLLTGEGEMLVNSRTVDTFGDKIRSYVSILLNNPKLTDDEIIQYLRDNLQKKEENTQSCLDYNSIIEHQKSQIAAMQNQVNTLMSIIENLTIKQK